MDSNHWCGSPSIGLFHQLRENSFLLLGHSWARKVWRPSRWLLVSILNNEYSLIRLFSKEGILCNEFWARFFISNFVFCMGEIYLLGTSVIFKSTCLMLVGNSYYLWFLYGSHFIWSSCFIITVVWTFLCSWDVRNATFFLSCFVLWVKK